MLPLFLFDGLVLLSSLNSMILTGKRKAAEDSGNLNGNNKSNYQVLFKTKSPMKIVIANLRFFSIPVVYNFDSLSVKITHDLLAASLFCNSFALLVGHIFLSI
jgi:hypothetical protein